MDWTLEKKENSKKKKKPGEIQINLSIVPMLIS